MAVQRLKALVVATKSPFPPVGGGNVALHALLQALPGAGVDVRVVAPEGSAVSVETPEYPVRFVPTAPRPWRRLGGHIFTGLPVTIARYHLPALGDAVAEEIESFAPDVVHLEQLHLSWLLRRLAHRRPVVLRQQNVESLVLSRLAEVRRGPLTWMLRREARRMAALEADACTRADVVAAISERDAAALKALAPRARVEVLPAAWPAGTPAQRVRLVGEPPFLCLGSFDWLPNRDGTEWFLDRVWPRLRKLIPTAVVHLAGPGSERLSARHGEDGVVRHGRVPVAAELYDPRCIALIPLRAGSGVRLRLLEAWAAGAPVVTTPIGGEGLLDGDGDAALIASTCEDFAAAAARLAADTALRERLIEGGRRRLIDYSAARVAERARDLYARAIARAAAGA